MTKIIRATDCYQSNADHNGNTFRRKDGSVNFTTTRLSLVSGALLSCILLLSMSTVGLQSQPFEEIKILSPTRSGSDFFSNCIAVSDRFLFASEMGDNFNRGAVHVYEIDPWTGEWSFSQTLLASDPLPDAFFGSCLSVDDTILVVGAQTDSHRFTDAGSAYIFELTEEGWQERQKIVAEDQNAGDRFGTDVSISGDIIVVGAQRKETASGDRPGAAYVFRRMSSADSSFWSEEARLLASDGVDYDDFGVSVCAYEERVLVGAFSHDHPLTNSGAAYVYTYDSTSQEWFEEQKLTPENPAVNGGFGLDLILRKNLIVVGRPTNVLSSDSGSVHVFVPDSESDAWIENAVLHASDASLNDMFGLGLAIIDSLLLVGAPEANGRESDAGAAYLFMNDDGDWSEQQKFTASDGMDDDWFGIATAFFKSDFLVGSLADVNGLFTGAVYHYRPVSTSLHVSEPASNSSFMLLQNYPNPFNGETTIKMRLPGNGSESPVTITVYDNTGSRCFEQVMNGLRGGEFEIRFDARNLPSGIYYYRLTSGPVSMSQRMLLVR